MNLIKTLALAQHVYLVIAPAAAEHVDRIKAPAAAQHVNLIMILVECLRSNEPHKKNAQIILCNT